jgi:hypothetical protein
MRPVLDHGQAAPPKEEKKEFLHNSGVIKKKSGISASGSLVVQKPYEVWNETV